MRLKKPETPVGLTRQITALEADLANTSVAAAQTPKGGMQRLERARKANVVTNLKNKRTRLGKTKK